MNGARWWSAALVVCGCIAMAAMFSTNTTAGRFAVLAIFGVSQGLLQLYGVRLHRRLSVEVPQVLSDLGLARRLWFAADMYKLGRLPVQDLELEPSTRRAAREYAGLVRASYVILAMALVALLLPVVA